MKILLTNRNFLSMWFSNFISILNSRFSELVIPLVVLGLTSSPLITGLVALSQQLGTVLFAIPIGTWAERKNKVRLAATCYFLYAFCNFLLAYFIFQNQANEVFIAFILFFMGILALISRTAFNTMIPNVAGRQKLLEAHTSLEAADAICTLIGPAIGGALLAAAGAGITLALCGFLFIFSMIFILIVKHREKTTDYRKKHVFMKSRIDDFIRQSVEGLNYLVANPPQLISTLVMCILGFSTVFIVLTVIFHARLSFDLSEELIGILLSSAGVGNIIGVFMMKWFKNANWLLLFSMLLLISSLGVLIILITNQFLVMCLGMLIFDGALSMAFVVQGAVHQGITPDEFLSRVRSATYVVSGIFSMLGTFLAGAIPEVTTSKVALGLGVAMLAVPGIYIIKFKRFSVKFSKIEPVYLKEKSGKKA